MPPRPRTSKSKTSAPLPSEGVEDALAVINTPEQALNPPLDDGGSAIPAALQFTTSTGDSDTGEVEDADVLEFSVDGTALHAIKPTPEQWGVLMGLMANVSTVAERIHALQTFASHVLDETSYMYVQNRMLDRNDKFGTDVYNKMLNAIIDHFSPKMNREERRRLARDTHR